MNRKQTIAQVSSIDVPLPDNNKNTHAHNVRYGPYFGLEVRKWWMPYFGDNLKRMKPAVALYDFFIAALKEKRIASL